MESTFRLAALGIQPGQNRETVRTAFKALFKGNDAAFDNTFHQIDLGQRVVLGENIQKDKAQALLEKLTAIGLSVRLDPMKLSLAPIEDDGVVYQCPACNHRQPMAIGNNLDICERCGIIGRNYHATSDLRQAMERERLRVKELLEREQREELENASDKDNRKQEKAQLELLEQARRQAEKSLGITPWRKFRMLLKRRPEIVYPTLGSLTVALIGVGLLVWQLQFSSTNKSRVADSSEVAAIPSATGQAGAEAMIATIAARAGNAATGAPGQAGADAITAAVDAQTGGGAPSAAGQSGADAVTAATASQANGGAGATALATRTRPVPLLNVDKLALPSPADSGKTARDPRLWVSLARYQAQSGNLAAAVRSIDQAVELLSAERRNLSAGQLDAFNRAQAEVQAAIAYQYHQQKDLATAKTYWSRATNLTHSITTPDERAQALSGLARTLNNVQDSAANDYFSQAIEMTRLVTEPFSQTLILGVIARDLAQAGRLQQSETLFKQAAAIKTMPNPDGQLVAQALLAKHLAEAGDSGAAKALLDQIAGKMQGGNRLSLKQESDLYQYQAKAFSALALGLAGRGETALARADFTAALQQAQVLADPAQRAEILLYLARDVAMGGDRVAAAKLAAVSGSWN